MIDKFTTSDYKLAATLMSLGFDLNSSEEILDNGKPMLVFGLSGDKINETANEYFLGKLSVNPHTLFEKITMLKNIMFDMKNKRYG